mmetsp:Transcript_16592/g.23389  ORF Transcript_16592/g.23389 Transcript_16592/m.23389 type:complete len:193 (-) Transcript_16592:39-617(-)
MISRRIKTFGIASLLVPLAGAQFGVNKKNAAADVGAQEVGADGKVGALTGMLDDPEMTEAIDMFANMSPEEMEETMQELMNMFGDDPETAAAIQDVMKEIGGMDGQAVKQSMEEMMAEKQVAGAIGETLEMLANADEGMFKTILGEKDAILESVIESGSLSAEDIAKYRNDPSLWEAELKHIWLELKKQANS